MSDCFNYDDNPDLDMYISEDGFDYTPAVVLSARRHVACTETIEPLGVEAGSSYFVSFQKKNIEGTRVRYALKFNDIDSTTVEVTDKSDSMDWEELTSFVTAPDTATEMRLIIYALPEIQGVQRSVSAFDDFFVTEIPDLQDKVVLTASNAAFVHNMVSEFTKISPVEYRVNVENISQEKGIAILLQESFHPGWDIQLVDGQLEDNEISHTADISGLNVWEFGETDKFGDSAELRIFFSPQDSLQTGAAISGATILAIFFSGAVIAWRNRG